MHINDHRRLKNAGVHSHTKLDVSLSDNIIGNWAWQQLSVARKKNPGWLNNPAAAVGTLTVSADGTFTVWNALKYASEDTYFEADASGTWTKIADGVYKLVYTPNYYYDVFVCGNVAHFIAMSITDSYDRGQYEYGIMFRNLDIAALKTYYQAITTPNVIATGNYKGAIMSLTSAQAIPYNTLTNVAWTRAIKNDLGIWSAGDNTKLTVPEGASLVKLSANSNWESDSTGQRAIGIIKNGVAATDPMPVVKRVGYLGSEDNVVSPPYDVVPGDYFQCVVLQTGVSPDLDFGTATYETWFCMEILD